MFLMHCWIKYVFSCHLHGGVWHSFLYWDYFSFMDKTSHGPTCYNSETVHIQQFHMFVDVAELTSAIVLCLWKHLGSNVFTLQGLAVAFSRKIGHWYFLSVTLALLMLEHLLHVLYCGLHVTGHWPFLDQYFNKNRTKIAHNLIQSADGQTE